MKTVIFSNEHVDDPAFYVHTETDVPGWSAFLYPGTPPKEKTTVTLKETWELAEFPALYVFAPRAFKGSAKAFVKKLREFANTLDSPKTAIVWVRDPDSPLTDDNLNVLEAQESSTGDVLVRRDANFLFGYNVYFSINTNCLLSFDEDSQQFVIKKQYGNILFTYKSHQSDADIDDNTVYFPFQGSSRGTFRFGINIDEEHFYDNYSVGLRFYYGSQNKAISMVYSLFQDSTSTSLRFDTALDPIMQAYRPEGHRTYLAYTSGDTALKSCYRTRFGHEIQFYPKINSAPNPDRLPYSEPQSGQAMLVFLPQRKDIASLDLPMGMVPCGDFHLSVPKEDDSQDSDTTEVFEMIGGLSGTESLTFLGRSKTFEGDFLQFEPGAKANSPVFPLQDPSQEEPAQTLLNDTYVTAWAALRPGASRPDVSGSAIRYLAQPKGSPMYASTDDPEILPYHTLPSASLNQAKDLFFPLVPYGGLSVTQVQADFEYYILSPERKFQIDRHTAQNARLETAGTQSVYSTTPQGLLLKTDSSTGAWENLIFARNQEKPNSEQKLTMQFENLGAELRQAFQTNQQFLVVSQNEKTDSGQPVLGTFQNAMSIEGWPFNVEVPEQASEGNYNNVLIFKFCDGSFYDRVKNPSLWTQASVFNARDSLKDLSSWLTRYCDEAINKAKTDGGADYQHFASIIQDPAWNGILALKTNLPLSHFPDALKGLLGGIDTSKLNGHHLGVNFNRVTVQAETGKLDFVSDSSLFGLIDYNQPNSRILSDSSETDYDFDVLKLTVRFDNSKITVFRSELQLKMNRLFGSEVTETEIGGVTKPSNLILFHGTFENHNGKPTYIFNTPEQNLYKLDNNVLKAVEMLKADFNTVDPGKDGAKPVVSRFSFWGRLHFHTLAYSSKEGTETFDLFSYGNVSKGEMDATGLVFSHLAVDMQFDIKTPAKRDFVFDPSHMVFDPSQSVARSHGLAAHFPVKLSGLIVGKDKQTPASAGWLNVSSPLQSSPVSGEWYGLEFQLPLGTLGSLASQADLTSNFALCWSPESQADRSSYGVFIGLRFPGIGKQDKMLSLQGVLKLSMNTLRLAVTEKGAYVLMLNDISLQFIGKKLPPNADIDFYLFGNPNQKAMESSLGWYAAYQKKSGR